MSYGKDQIKYYIDYAALLRTLCIEIGFEPSISEKLFSIFLFIAVCIILVRMIGLAWMLCSFRRKREFINDGNIAFDRIAKSALKGLYKLESKSSRNEDRAKADDIDTRFRFLWATCSARIQSTKTLAVLTFILSFGVAAIGFYNICTELMIEETAGIRAVAGAGREIFAWLAYGLFISWFFYLFALLFESVLDRRLRDWNYLKRSMKEKSDLG